MDADDAMLAEKLRHLLVERSDRGVGANSIMRPQPHARRDPANAAPEALPHPEGPARNVGEAGTDALRLLAELADQHLGRSPGKDTGEGIMMPPDLLPHGKGEAGIRARAYTKTRIASGDA